MTKYLQNYLFLDAGSDFGSASSMQIRIQGTSHNADPCGSGSVQHFTTSTSTNTKYDKIPVLANLSVLDAGSEFGSASFMQIRIQGASDNADPCRSGSTQQFTTSTSMVPIQNMTKPCGSGYAQ